LAERTNLLFFNMFLIRFLHF